MRHAAIQPKPWMPFEGAASLGVVALGACVAAIAVALANQPYFDLVNRAIGARESVARGVLFSSWLVLLAVPIVARRPAAFGIGIGALRRDAGLVVAVCAAGAAVTFAILRLFGARRTGAPRSSSKPSWSRSRRSCCSGRRS
jgi:hypothetical protein